MENNCECKICNKIFFSVQGLSSHIVKNHKTNVKDYYDNYIKGRDKCKICETKTKFLSLKSGYQVYCSKKCSNSDLEKQGISKNTCLYKYGVENPFQNKEVKEKIKQTNLEKFGVKNPKQSKEIQEKIKQTCLDKYGFDHPCKTQLIKDKNRKTRILNFLPKVQKILDASDLVIIGDYIDCYSIFNVECNKCHTKFGVTYFNLSQRCNKCPTCHPRNNGFSKQEKEVLEFIKNLGFLDVLENNKTILECKEDKRKSKELDIYIPNLKIAVEYNGLYRHSDEWTKNPFYHLNKTIECEKQGIRLIHIFEDEWELKKDIVKSRLKQILNKSNSIKIHARKCVIKEIPSKEKDDFLERYHIQGKDISKIRLGSFYNNELISIMTFSHGNIAKGSKNQKDIWELNRFCTNSDYHIAGIASKLLSYFKKNYEWSEIFSYADRRWSLGDLYCKLGFELDHITSPNYWYIKGMKRIHRFNLRKRPDEPKDISESILRLQEGYSKIWDCGNLKFKLVNN